MIKILQNVKEPQGGGTSLVVQGLRLHAPNVGGPDSIPGQGNRSHMPQLKKIPHAATKIQHAAMKIPRSQINTLKKNFFFKKEPQGSATRK